MRPSILFKRLPSSSPSPLWGEGRVRGVEVRGVEVRGVEGQERGG
jgi:hypothetical protein